MGWIEDIAQETWLSFIGYNYPDEGLWGWREKKIVKSPSNGRAVCFVSNVSFHVNPVMFALSFKERI